MAGGHDVRGTTCRGRDVGSLSLCIFYVKPHSNLVQTVAFERKKMLTSKRGYGIIMLPLRVGFFVVPESACRPNRHRVPPLRREVHGRVTDVIRPCPIKILMGGAAIMANDARVKITLACTECKQRNYDTKKNKKNDPDRLEMNKYCRFCRKHTLHKETK